MAIEFKVIERGEPGVEGGGTKKYYASIVTSGEVNISELTKAIEKISTVSGADIRAVIYALVDVSVAELSRGHIIRLGDMGSIRMSIKSEGVLTEDEVTVAVIKGTRIIFTPGKLLKEMQKTLKFKKV